MPSYQRTNRVRVIAAISLLIIGVGLVALALLSFAVSGLGAEADNWFWDHFNYFALVDIILALSAPCISAGVRLLKHLRGVRIGGFILLTLLGAVLAPVGAIMALTSRDMSGLTWFGYAEELLLHGGQRMLTLDSEFFLAGGLMILGLAIVCLTEALRVAGTRKWVEVLAVVGRAVVGTGLASIAVILWWALTRLKHVDYTMIAPLAILAVLWLVSSARLLRQIRRNSDYGLRSVSTDQAPPPSLA